MRRVKNTPADVWSMIKKGESDECWEFQGGRNRQGYGNFSLDGKTAVAHRLVYILTFGDIPAGLIVRHTCDNPPCCNPRHLLLGTTKDNSLDMVSRGRHRGYTAGFQGEAHPRAKLSIQKAKAIRQKFSKGVPMLNMAKEYNVSPAAIWQVLQGNSWNYPEAYP